MFETQKQKERVVIIGVDLGQSEQFDWSMDELKNLAQTAGAVLVGCFVQKRESYDSSTVIGSGKLSEIKQFISQEAVDTVIINNRLTPRQNNRLEDELKVKVIDRLQLILEIFAMRARSHEGKLQVKLAQLNYILPRLSGQGILLSRQAGGIGSRGPGESQLELNRRTIHRQIIDLERELKQVEKKRQLTGFQRREHAVFQIGLIGYTNVGKSTIMSLLSHRKQYEADELFATLDATTKMIKLKSSFEATLTDTVGFIQDLPTELISSFKSTLEESRHVDLLLHVVDASHPNHEEQEKVVLKLMKELEMDHIPVLTIYNKMDKVTHFFPTLFPNISLSARADDAANQLREAIIDAIKSILLRFDIMIEVNRYTQFEKLAPLILFEKREYLEDKQHIIGYIHPDNQWRLEKLYGKLY